MIGKQGRSQETMFMPGSLYQSIPDDHILKRVDKVLDLSELREEVRDRYEEENGRLSIDPEAAVRLMPAGLFEGIVQDRKLMRQAEVNPAIRWFAGYEIQERLPNHSSLTRIRQRWGADRFRRIFEKTVESCMRLKRPIDGPEIPRYRPADAINPFALSGEAARRKTNGTMYRSLSWVVRR